MEFIVFFMPIVSMQGVLPVDLEKENKYVNQTYMKEKPVLRLVLAMSLPMVISMMVNSLYNIVDSFFVAKISEGAMTALSLVFPVQNLVSAVAIGFAIGINAVISFYLGAQEQKQANAAATVGLLLSAVHGIILTIGCFIILPGFLKMFTPDMEIVGLGLRYSHIALSFSVIIGPGIAFEKIFQAVGKMTVSMISMMSGCIVNIILDPILIFGLGAVPAMGIEGAAIATGIGQVVTLLIYIVIFIARPIHVKIGKQYLEEGSGIVKKLYAIGIPAALNMALPSLLISSLNAILAVYSQAYVVVLGVYYKLQTFLYLPANGIVQGMRPLVGYNYGAGEHKRVKDIYRVALCLTSSIMVLGTILCLAVPGTLMGLFTENSETVMAGAKALRIICIGFIVSAVSVTSSGALEGLGKGVPSLLISLLRYVVIIIPAAFLLSHFAGAAGVWHAFWITEGTAAIASYFIYRRATR